MMTGDVVTGKALDEASATDVTIAAGRETGGAAVPAANAGDVSPIERALARFEHASAALSAVAKARRPGLSDGEFVDTEWGAIAEDAPSVEAEPTAAMPFDETPAATAPVAAMPVEAAPVETAAAVDLPVEPIAAEPAPPASALAWPVVDTTALAREAGVERPHAGDVNSVVDSVWLETATLESDSRGAALWDAAPAPAPAPAAQPMRVARSAFVPAANDDDDDVADEHASARRPKRLVAMLAVAAVLAGGGFVALKPQVATSAEGPRTAAAAPAVPALREAVVLQAAPAPAPMPAVASTSVAPPDVAAAARIIEAAPTAAGKPPAAAPAGPRAAAVASAPAPAMPARRPMLQERPSPQVSAAVAAAQQKADSFLGGDAAAAAGTDTAAH